MKLGFQVKIYYHSVLSRGVEIKDFQTHVLYRDGSGEGKFILPPYN